MARWPQTPDERFWSKVDRTGDCWVVLGKLSSRGYGVTSRKGKSILAHRLAYEQLVGPIPEGLTIDHLCRNRRCVNPKHLEPVPPAVNTLRGNGFSGLNARKTGCPRGHAYDYVIPSNGGRLCRRCNAENARRWRREQKEVAR